MMKKKSNQQTLGEAIQLMIQELGIEEKILETQISESWEKIMGKMIARYTEKTYVKNKILYVKIKSPELKDRLMYEKLKIVSLVNEELNQNYIVDVKFL